MTQKETKKNPVDEIKKNDNKENFLILHNDDIHSFDYVIDALIEVCNHNFEQAAQCALITHHKGKCDVKKGGFEKLKSLKTALNDKKLTVTID